MVLLMDYLLEIAVDIVNQVITVRRGQLVRANMNAEVLMYFALPAQTLRKQLISDTIHVRFYV